MSVTLTGSTVAEELGLAALPLLEEKQDHAGLAQMWFALAAHEPKATWKVPGSTHTGGFHARPREYERRVVTFFDQALLKNQQTR